MARRVRSGKPERSRRARAVRAILYLLLALLALEIGYVALHRDDPIRGDLALVRSSRPGFRVLFVGNSLTERNSMITMLRKLGESAPGKPPIFAVEYAPGGSSLANAARDRRLQSLISGERWTYVVLQEQSRVPTLPKYTRRYMYPAAEWLARAAWGAGASSILFMTWARRHGEPAGHDGYRAMQEHVGATYLDLGRRLRTTVAPVGFVWRDALARRPGLGLWAGDGYHPSKEGSYLTACVFYAVITHRDPALSSFTAGLDRSEAHWLAARAWEGVLGAGAWAPAPRRQVQAPALGSASGRGSARDAIAAPVTAPKKANA